MDEEQSRNENDLNKTPHGISNAMMEGNHAVGDSGERSSYKGQIDPSPGGSWFNPQCPTA